MLLACSHPAGTAHVRHSTARIAACPPVAAEPLWAVQSSSSTTRWELDHSWTVSQQQLRPQGRWTARATACAPLCHPAQPLHMLLAPGPCHPAPKHGGMVRTLLHCTAWELSSSKPSPPCTALNTKALAAMHSCTAMHGPNTAALHSSAEVTPEGLGPG